jgi:hypothetical protein
MLTKVTVAPTGTVRVVGSKAKSISIAIGPPAPVPLAADVGLPAPAAVALGVVLAPLEQATRPIINALAIARTRSARPVDTGCFMSAHTLQVTRRYGIFLASRD